MTEIKIQDWRYSEGNTRVGVFNAELPNGLVILNLQLHEDHGKLSLKLPKIETTDKNGDTEHINVIAFSDQRAAEEFGQDVLAAIKDHLLFLQAESASEAEV